ncbi:MAG: 16S rRNA (guanine(527)-N(7))-methyltransferase RsmG [Gammaproteobacteria bacterium]|nr:16S rRNA (guanine(527)-N(7))-methyltransferase RsmG [Gammaproteobacteria bacterium]
MDLLLNAQQQERLLDYLSLLNRWNKIYNLTAVRDPNEVVSRQLLDSLSILPLLSGHDILDVGTGPGLPGIPLAIARPDLCLTLLDSNSKKSRFVVQAKIELQLGNLTVARGRVEKFAPDTLFDMVLSRAFASLPDMLALSSHLVAAGGCVLAMKGAVHQEEIDAAVEKSMAVEIYALKVPGTIGQRHAVVCRSVEQDEEV